MSGFAGIVRIDGAAVNADVLERMAARLDHRGPDQDGMWVDPTRREAGLAVRRLAVIDPEGSPQPLSNEDSGLRLACDGAVYNYRELRDRLRAKGHVFKTAGDSEVLVHLYEEHGPALLDHVEGMFALAIWDGRRRRLMLARDRLGQKPLYWWCGPDCLIFASEPAALFEHPDVPRQADRRALGAFLRFGYVPAPATGFAGVRKLPPAHYIEFDADAARLKGPRRWWDIPRGPAEEGLSAAEWRIRLLEALSEAVRRRLVADVPVGILLSGGVDSSAVVALAARTGGPLRTFTVRFEESGWDESAYARAVARRFGTHHTEIRVRPQCARALEELVRHHGDPFADSSAIAMYHLAREARREVVVALSGDGGDESFGGYPRHAALALSERMSPRLRARLARIGRRMRPRAGRKSRWNAARRFFRALDLEPLPRYLAWRSLFSPADLAALLTPDFAAEALADDPLDAWRAATAGLESRPIVDRAMAIDLQDYLPNDCLAKVDIASMRHSLEVRSPMLDRRVVELARRMPVDLKWRPRGPRPPLGKAILREALRGRLPPGVLRRRKMGFGVPVSRWLAGEDAAWMREVLLDGRALGRGLFQRGAVEEMIDAHTARRADHGDQLWALLCLELWFRTFLD